MSSTPGDIRQFLMASNPEFRQLADEHSRYESQLEQIDKAPYLNSEDLILQSTLKKLKLRAKDRMEELIARYRRRSTQP